MEIFAWPLAAGVLGAAAVAEVSAIYRAVAPRPLREFHVREAARAMFYARGIHATTKRTGVLVYIALRASAWSSSSAMSRSCRRSTPRRARVGAAIAAKLPDGVAAGKALGALAGELAQKLPHGVGDHNELADDVIEIARHPRGKRTRGVAP